MRLFIPFFIALAVGSASALVIRHDTPTLDYENYGNESQFNASLNIFKDGNAEFGALAGSTAIDSRWGVHARHTLKSVSDWLDDGNVARIRGTRGKGVSFQGLGAVVVEQVIHYDDDFSRFTNGIDIALVQSKAPHSGLRIAPLYSGWDEVGRVGSAASAANNRNNGNGVSAKPEAQATSNSNRWYEVRWGGKNEINVVSGASFQGSPSNTILQADFDHPTDTSRSRFGGNTAIDLEYGSMNGDSGSPVYLDKDGVIAQVAGVLSGGSGNEYGDSIVYVRTRPYRTWITDTVLANPDSWTLSLETIPDQLVSFGGSIDLHASASGSDLPPQSVSYSLVSPPTGASIDAVTGAISWTPPVNFAGTSQMITVQAKENGVVANSVTTDFEVTITGSDITEFWSWVGGAPAWKQFSGANAYNLGGAFPYMQGSLHNSIYQEITGTIPQWATVTMKLKVADFDQTWTSGGEVEFGFYDGVPSSAEPDAAYLFSSVADVPNYNGEPLVNGLGNTGGNVDYFFSFQAMEEMTDPVFAVRKNFDGGRVAVDDVEVSYFFEDQDEDGLPDLQELSLGTDPAVVDSDGDGLGDGAEVAAGTNPLETDSDFDGYADGYEVNVLLEDPLDADSPGGPNPLAIGVNFNSLRGQEASTARMLPVNAYAGAPEVAQRNWNQTGALNIVSKATRDLSSIATPSAGGLVDSGGALTSVGLSYTMNNTWNIDNEKLTPYGSLYAGYLDTNANNNASVTFSEIPYASYDVYVYLGAGGSGATQKITDGETTYSFTMAARSTEAGSYTLTSDTGENFPSANYAKFSGKTDSSVTVTFLRGSANGGITGIQIVATEQPTPYEVWASAQGLDILAEGAPGADADGDGESNLLEFILLSDPSDGGSRSEISLAMGVSESVLNFTKTREAGDYVTSVKWSDNLVDWWDVGVVMEEADLNAGETEVSASIPLSPSGARYFRVEVSGP